MTNSLQTRRAALGMIALAGAGSIALPAIPSAAMAASSRRDSVAALLESGHHSDAETARLCDAMDAQDDMVRAAPCQAAGDALAKLKSVARDLAEGQRANTPVSAEETLQQVMAWLEATA